MKIREILKEAQPGYYEKLVNKRKNKKKSEKLSERDLKELMKQRSYKRGTGGAIRQIR